MDNLELERRAKITHETCDGIQPMHLAFYGQSIHYSAERCLNAFGRYDSMIGSDDAYELISSIQEAIGHAAALSRYFWPTSMGKKKEIPEQLAMRQSRVPDLTGDKRTVPSAAGDVSQQSEKHYGSVGEHQSTACSADCARQSIGKDRIWDETLDQCCRRLEYG